MAFSTVNYIVMYFLVSAVHCHRSEISSLRKEFEAFKKSISCCKYVEKYEAQKEIITQLKNELSLQRKLAEELMAEQGRQRDTIRQILNQRAELSTKVEANDMLPSGSTMDKLEITQNIQAKQTIKQSSRRTAISPNLMSTFSQTLSHCTSEVNKLRGSSDMNTMEIQGLLKISSELVKVNNNLTNEIQSVMKSDQVQDNAINILNSSCQENGRKVSQLIQIVTDTILRQNTHTQQIQNIKSKNDIQSHTLHNITSELNRQSQQIQNIVRDNNNQEMELQSLKNRSDSRERHIQELNNKETFLEQELKRLKNESEIKSLEIQTLKSNDVKYEHKIQNLIGELTSVTEKTKSLQSANAIQTQRIQRIETKIAKIDQDLQKYHKKVAFYAKFSRRQNAIYGKPLIYDKVILNIGSAFQAHSGLFRTPSKGTYLFYVHIYSPVKSQPHMALYVNGHDVASLPGEIGSNLAIVHLNVGDRVGVYPASSNHAGGVLQFSLNSFSGVLLYPE